MKRTTPQSHVAPFVTVVTTHGATSDDKCVKLTIPCLLSQKWYHNNAMENLALKHVYLKQYDSIQMFDIKRTWQFIWLTLASTWYRFISCILGDYCRDYVCFWRKNDVAQHVNGIDIPLKPLQQTVSNMKCIKNIYVAPLRLTKTNTHPSQRTKSYLMIN